MDGNIERIIENSKQKGDTSLHLHNKGMRALPPSIGQLTQLEALYLHNNDLQSLPPELGQLKGLRILDLSQNKLRSLPPEIGELFNLTDLFLYDNELVELPAEIKRLSNLTSLDITNNKIILPPEIISKIHEPKTIISYYFEYLGRRRPLREAKLLIVGQGSVGKTSLARRLIENEFNVRETKTEGISIKRWSIESSLQNAKSSKKLTNENVVIRLNIWDFGGQEIMHATHQFFLTKRSVYLLVLDSRLTQEENRVEYWLKLIQSFGGESPVIIVGNKTDQHPLDIDRSGLRKRYSNIVDILDTSASTGAGFEKLKHTIIRQVTKLPHIYDLIPEAWFAIKASLEDRGHVENFITRDQYLELCAKEDVTNEISQQTLIGFLHDLGVVIHYQDDPRLVTLGILNPLWVTNGVYKILNSHAVFQNKGVLTLSLLNEILSTGEYPKDKRLFMVDMMSRFELCYAIESQQAFLVPDLLPKDEPFTGDWSNALAFQYKYNVLPTSIISRFIVRMNEFIHQPTTWRSGAILKSKANTALVRADYEERKISIGVLGTQNTRRDFLSIIRGTFELIHQSISKLEVASQVPHPEYPKLVLDYAELLEFERQGVKEFPRKVDNQIVICIVRTLLAGVDGKQNPKIFISYSRNNRQFADRLVNALRSAQIDAWIDTTEIDTGKVWSKEIESGIVKSDFVLVIMSPDAMESKWVTKEINYAESKNIKIIPILYKECHIPITLIDKQYFDFTKARFDDAVRALIDSVKEEHGQ